MSGRSQATSFRGALATRFSLRWLASTLAHNLPRPAELARPAELWTTARTHYRLRHEGYTMLSSRKGRTLMRLAGELERSAVPGAIVDCGVWNGGSSVLLSLGAPSRRVWAFDSFAGLPPPGALDGADSAGWEGAYRGSAVRVRDGFARYSNTARLRIVEGWFEDTMPTVADEIGPIALLHVDADWYESVKLALETFYPAVSPGGVVVIDDYTSWTGARRATDEFRAAAGVSSALVDAHWWRK